MHFVKQLREAAMVCSNIELRNSLKAIADELSIALKQLNEKGDSDSLIAVNGAWVRAHKIFDNYNNGDSGGGGSMPVPNEELALKVA